jgi:aspartyl-tRNA(Asn)/glutamyl-tRNA(Gln) amidotransferase subunit B
MDYRIVIGLEVHVQLLTRTKLFCGCSTLFGLPPNSATCPVCLGLPGALPVMNRRAFELALKAALALNCTIAPFTKWDRKNYYYPDLPKNYQISQYDLPFSRDGYLDIETVDGARRIGIIRVHLEEDAGKMLHEAPFSPLPRSTGGEGRRSLVDLNRAGTPLLEIVSRPELSTPEEAKTYLEEIRLLLRELEISDCEMQEGSLRCDANVNILVPLADPDTFAATPIIEVKNLNSFRAVERAMRYEAERQYQEYQEKVGSGQWAVGSQPLDHPPLTTHHSPATVFRVQEKRSGDLVPVSKATAGWNDHRGITEVQRRKEEAEDYRYFPEPDLVPVTVGSENVETVRAALGELPAAQRARLQTQYGLSSYDAGVISQQGRALVAYFEEVANRCGDAKSASNWIANDVLQVLNERKQSIGEFAVSAAALGDLITASRAAGLNKQRSREVFAEMTSSGLDAKQAIAKLGFHAVTDEGQLTDLVRQAIAANPKAVADFRKGKTKAIDAIKGAVMRQTRGLARADTVQRILMEELEKGKG